MQKLLEKISNARKNIAENKIKKLGKNKFANYDYFTPEQIYQLTSDAEQKNGLISKFDLMKNETSTKGVLTIFDIESGVNLSFEMTTAIPEIKATNLTQQLGGTVTYTHRYLLTTAYKIAENHLDFDSDENSPANEKNTKKADIIWLTESQFLSALNSTKKGIETTLIVFNSETKKMKKEYKIQLENKLKETEK
jgi:hypothetical protein